MTPTRRSFLKATASAGLIGGFAGETAASQPTYDWQAATWDAYWYSLYNMNTTIAVSGNGVVFPRTDEQRETLRQRQQAMLANAEVNRPPVVDPALNLAPFTTGDPHFTEKPVAPYSADVERINAGTLRWDTSESSGIVSPASVAWTHLKGVTWAKNFQHHFDRLPTEMAPRFRSQVLATIAQLSVRATLVDGGPAGNGLLTKGDDDLLLASAVDPAKGEVTDPAARPTQHAAMLWFLADLTSLARSGWFGYVNPEPLVPPDQLQQLTDGMARTVFEAFPPERVREQAGIRGVGLLLAATGWYGTHAGSAELRERAADYANGLASVVEDAMASDGSLEGVSGNQAAAQGIVGQGLVWASQTDGVDSSEMAVPALRYLLGSLWDSDANTFTDGSDDGTYRFTARDAADVTGGLNVAELLGLDDARERFAASFDAVFNRARLQRAERPQSRDESVEYPLPLPQNAGGEYGQAAVYNGAVEYDADGDEWSVADDTFRTGPALYLANQDIWISQWGGDFFEGRGVPGTNDRPAGE